MFFNKRVCAGLIVTDVFARNETKHVEHPRVDVIRVGEKLENKINELRHLEEKRNNSKSLWPSGVGSHLGRNRL